MTPHDFVDFLEKEQCQPNLVVEIVDCVLDESF